MIESIDAAINNREAQLPEAAWQVWYSDTFDRETPRQVEASGQSLVDGLYELWSRFLYETVQEYHSHGKRVFGAQGFARFYLTQSGPTITIHGDDAGAAKLRIWIYGPQPKDRSSFVMPGSRELLHTLVAAHVAFARPQDAGESLLAWAAECDDAEAFAVRLRKHLSNAGGSP
jgi:hypothetical protein